MTSACCSAWALRRWTCWTSSTTAEWWCALSSRYRSLCAQKQGLAFSSSPCAQENCRRLHLCGQFESSLQGRSWGVAFVPRVPFAAGFQEVLCRAGLWGGTLLFSSCGTPEVSAHSRGCVHVGGNTSKVMRADECLGTKLKSAQLLGRRERGSLLPALCTSCFLRACDNVAVVPQSPWRCAGFWKHHSQKSLITSSPAIYTAASTTLATSLFA